jgi:hypothetical protein
MSATAIDLIVEGEILNREIENVGTLRFEDLGPGEWLTQKGEPAKKARHRYALNGEDFTSVSSITGVLDKPGVYPWMEAGGIEGALEAVGRGLIDPSLHDGPAAVEIVRREKLGAEARRDKAAERGKAIHTVFHQYCETGSIPKHSEFPEEWQPWVKGAAQAILLLDPEPEEAEQIVCNPQYRYAGRPDLICRSRGRRVLIDYKTSAAGRVYDAAHYQTRGYAMCLEPCGIEPVEDIVIVPVGADGRVTAEDLVRCEATELDFIGLRSVYESRKRINKGMAEQRAALRKALA